MEIIEEIWRNIDEYGGRYQVSNMGRVRRAKDEFVLKPRGIWNYVALYGDDSKKNIKTANLVAKYFLPPPPQSENVKVVRIDPNTNDDRAVNLRYEIVKTRNRVDDEEKRLKAEVKRAEAKERAKASQKNTAIVQLRSNGGYVRRYYDVNELLSVHPTWEEEDVLKCLDGEIKDVYGWVFLWESEYEKK